MHETIHIVADKINLEKDSKRFKKIVNVKSNPQSVVTFMQEIFPINETAQVALDVTHQMAIGGGAFAASTLRAGIAAQEEMLKAANVWISGAENTYREASKATRIMGEKMAETAASGDILPFQQEIERWKEMTLDGMKKSMELFSMPFRNASK